MPKFHIFEIMKGQYYLTFFLGWLLLSVQWLCKILNKSFLPWSLALWWNFKLWTRMKVSILNNLYSHLFTMPMQLFSKYYFAVYNNTLWENLPLLPGQKIWRTLYVCTERIFDSRLLMCNKIFLKKYYRSLQGPPYLLSR